MPQDPKLPKTPADPELERLVSGVGRFSPQRGFEDRVVSRVRVPIPRWLRGLRDRSRALTSGVPGWTLLATFSVATAAAWTSAAVVGARYSGELAAVWDEGGRDLFRLLRQDVAHDLLPLWGVAQAEVARWLGSVGLDMQTAAIGYGGVVLLSAVALRWLTAAPHKTRGSVDAAS